MPDIDVRKVVEKNGFRGLVYELFFFVSSWYIAITAQNRFREDLAYFIPDGQGLMIKSLIDILTIVILVFFMYVFLKAYGRND